MRKEVDSVSRKFLDSQHPFYFTFHFCRSKMPKDCSFSLKKRRNFVAIQRCKPYDRSRGVFHVICLFFLRIIIIMVIRRSSRYRSGFINVPITCRLLNYIHASSI